MAQVAQNSSSHTFGRAEYLREINIPIDQGLQNAIVGTQLEKAMSHSQRTHIPVLIEHVGIVDCAIEGLVGQRAL